MSTNILVVLKNILDNPVNELVDFYENSVHNRANNMGDALEYYIKDLFCSTININSFAEKDKIYSEYLSYLGNSNNPPDFIIKQSAAVEVKKVENLSFGDIALNSSNPKDYLHSDSTLINIACKECENKYGGWTKKEFIYTIGNVIKRELRLLWILDGSCYCADDSVYKRIKNTIQSGIKTISGVEFAESRELGKVKKIDPLGVTDLRIRGMWSIKHPMKAFDYLVGDYQKDTKFQVYCLLLKDKFDRINEDDKVKLIEYIKKGQLEKENVMIKNPNNPAQFLEAVFFKISVN